MRQNVYTRFKQQQSAETDEFCRKYCEWAFGPEQFKALLDKLNMTKEEFEKNYTGFIGGGAIRRDKVEAWKDLCRKHNTSLMEKLLRNRTFAYNAFMYEFNNHECGYTRDYSRALAALGLTNSDISKYDRLLEAYKKATKTYEKWCEKHIW